MENNVLLHGADYNPEQWLDRPEVLEADIRLMRQSGCNVVSMGMFSWSFLEPVEGQYTFDWLAEIIENLYKNGISTILATPSGARPPWLAQRYPEVLRVDNMRRRALFGMRQNHCYTSDMYRLKTANIDRALSERFAGNPAVIMWHMSNEYGGECHCPLCQEAFRGWLKQRYGSLEALNKAWYTSFWSHVYTDWSQVESPSPIGEISVQGQQLDWKRFVTYQTVDFMKAEVAAIREGGSTAPTTTNLMWYYEGLNYFKFKDAVDVISWDSYPAWHMDSDCSLAVDVGMFHDLMRSIKKAPFLLMESTPTTTNWQPVSRLKRPGMHMISSLHAVAHGSDSVQYFQWRQSRGAYEKFHGAVIDHSMREDSRTFRDVTAVGNALKELSALQGTTTKAKAAVIFDWENWWAVESSVGPRNVGILYKETVQKHYRALSRLGLNIDVVDMECDLSSYGLIAAPMLYLLRAGIEEKLEAFVKNGGILVTGTHTGVVDENDICYEGNIPHGMTDVLGLYSEEIDALYDGQENIGMRCDSGQKWLKERYTCENLCELVHCGSARPLLCYGQDFYKDYPVFTENDYGSGHAYYLCTDLEQTGLDDIYAELVSRYKLPRCAPFALPYGVTATIRGAEGREFLLLQNFNHTDTALPLSQLSANGWCVLRREGGGDIMKKYETAAFERLL